MKHEPFLLLGLLAVVCAGSCSPDPTRSSLGLRIQPSVIEQGTTTELTLTPSGSMGPSRIRSSIAILDQVGWGLLSEPHGEGSSAEIGEQRTIGRGAGADSNFNDIGCNGGCDYVFKISAQGGCCEISH